MPRVAVDSKHFFTFVRGLITEATGITYPENSMIEGDNVDIDISGICKRRKGLDFEAGFSLSPPTITEEEARVNAITFHEWKSVNGVGSTNLWLLQVGTKLYIGTMSEASISDGFIGTFDIAFLRSVYNTQILSPSKTVDFVVNQEQAPFFPLDTSYGKGRLFCNSKYVNPFYIELDEETNLIKIKAIIIKERDFEGLNDGFAVDEKPSKGQINDDHLYNLKNQGWNDTEVSSSFTTRRDVLDSLNNTTEGGAGIGGIYNPLPFKSFVK